MTTEPSTGHDTGHDTGLRVGDVAAATGVSVRTLHHYEEVGLLSPTRAASGHRAYTPVDVARLYRVTSLRSLGLPLAEIGPALDSHADGLVAALRRHLGRLDEEATRLGRLRSLLADALASGTEGPGAAVEPLLAAVAEMSREPSAVHRRISILVYDDLAAVHAHLTGVLGLGAGELTRDGDGRVVHGVVHAGDGEIWLHQESAEFGLSSPRTLGAATATTAVLVDDVDAHHAAVVTAGGEIVYPPVDQPYGFREFSARDPEGGLWSFMRELPA